MRIASIWLTLIVLLITARVVGGVLQPFRFSLFRLYQCKPEPCWHDIRPGVTTMAQARAMLAADNGLAANLATVYDNCWYMVSAPSWTVCFGPPQAARNDSVGYLYLRFESAPEAPQLGDVLTLFGEPVGSKLCWYRFGTGLSNGRSFIGADVYFQDGLYAGAYNPREPDSFRLDPGRVVFLVSYARLSLPEAPRWRGFVEQTDQQWC
jgi:hypothetical protein